MSQHVIICGYGTKGQSAAATLKAQGEQHMVIIDTNEQNVAKANNHGYAAIHGNAARANVLKEARIHEAKTVIVAADRDDTAVLITLSARSLNPDIHIAAGVREEENAPLLRQSGANTVLVSSGATGRLLGMSSYSPQVVSLLEDLLDASDGLNIEDRLAAPEDIGPLSALKPKPEEILLALVRNDQVIRRHNYQDASFCIQENDHLIFLKLA